MEQAILSNATTPCHKVKEKQRLAESSQVHRPENSQFSPYIKVLDHSLQLALHVEGMHCARCIWAIESTLSKEQDVLEARVNMSTSRLIIRWQGNPSQADYLVGLVKKLGYGVTPLTASATPVSEIETARLQRYMVVAGFAMGNIMLISVALWSSNNDIMGIATRELLHWLSALIALPTVIYCGRPFFASAWHALSSRRTNMDVPISLALILASVISISETLQQGEHAYFDSVIMLLFFLLIGRWLDAKARGKARRHAAELLELLQGTATLLEQGNQRMVAINTLQADDVVLVAAGEKIPSDAVVVSGTSEVDVGVVTGESIPKMVQEGSQLYGGTINLTAPLTCRILQPSEDSLLAEVVRLMEKAEQGRAHYIRLADKAARLYTPVVHTLAALAFAGWIIFGGMAWQDALMIAVTTLIITCPCALALAVPVVQVLAVEQLMKRGILVKTADALERLNAIDTVIFDKTGTLTIGMPRVERFDGDTSTLQLAASLAAYSRHPLSRAITNSYKGELLGATHLEEIAGKGIRGQIGIKTLFLGRDDKHNEDASTVVSLYEDGKPIAGFLFSDTLRDSAKTTIKAFASEGITSCLLSGDNEAIVRDMAGKLCIPRYKAALLPDEKLLEIHTLQQSGRKCLMVGDGLNDAPALAQADISMSPATGMDITQNTADLVFQGTSLKAVFHSWKIARFSTRLVKQNFGLAVMYNAFAIPLAVMGYVTPLVAAIAMSSSSLLVIGNAFRIRKTIKDL